MNKLKIYLCDLVHNYLGAGSYMFPLNVGYVGAYVQKKFGEKVDLKLFKYPDKLLETINQDIPDVIGFSNYTWSENLNNQLSQIAKKKSPNIITVFGGPNIDYTDEGVKDFFESHPGADFYLPYQGELSIINLLNKIFKVGLDPEKLKEFSTPGVFTYNRETKKPVKGKKLERIKNPDDIPSPYLTGLLDDFFECNLIPIIETNRGCPYQCTYCCQGLASFHQINYFSMERVKAEIDYIADHVKRTNLLNFADSNFGIVLRDVDIAKYVAETKKRTGYPRRVNTNWAKNQPKVFKIAEILDNINLIISLQSLDEQVLKNVKRLNVRLEIFKDIIDKVIERGAISGTEIILGLPGETRESHIKTLRILFDWDVSYIICYNGLVLLGSELDLERKAGKYNLETKFRLIDSAFGKYNGITSFEVEEGIMSNGSMTEDDLLSFRPVHWLIQFLWNYRFYYDFLKYAKTFDINPLDIIIKIIEDSSQATEEISGLFNEFKTEAKEEWFDSEESLHEYYNKPENFKKLQQGQFGKMNGKYVFKTLLEVKKEFEDYLYETTINFSPKLAEKKDILFEIMTFHSKSILDFTEDFEEIHKERFLETKYNILAWRESRFKADIKKYYDENGFKFRFFLPKEQEDALKKLLNQYAHENKNVTLRKMSEHMPTHDLFYKAELVK